jgi:hypothetical protein
MTAHSAGLPFPGRKRQTRQMKTRLYDIIESEHDDIGYLYLGSSTFENITFDRNRLSDLFKLSKRMSVNAQKRENDLNANLRFRSGP